MFCRVTLDQLFYVSPNILEFFWGEKMHTKVNLTKIFVAGSAATIAATNSAAAQGFEGLFLGLGVASHSGQLGQGTDLDELYAVGSQPVAQAFAGYNFVNGDMVFGGEIAIHSSPSSADTNYGVTKATDLKARVGRIFGNTMIYGSLGVSSGEYVIDGDEYDEFGAVLVGVGFETNLTDSMFLGADLTARYITSDTYGGAGKIGNYGPMTTASSRGGMRF